MALWRKFFFVYIRKFSLTFICVTNFNVKIVLITPFRWDQATVSVAGKEFLPGHRLDPNAAYLDIMTNYSKIEKETVLFQAGYREDTPSKSDYAK